MYFKRMLSLATVFALALSMALTVSAAEVDCDSVYCFSSSDFSQEEELVGICITELTNAGAVMLGTRVIQPGDILTADQLAQMTFAPLQTQQDAQAVISYLPIYADRVEDSATMTIAIRGKEDKAPAAEDFALETYKNLPNQGKLKVTDPEGEAMTYTLLRQPKRGEVTIESDGTFTYTPKKNKVGVDSFTYTATDPAGNVSREATVTIQILKPSEAKQYTDTAGSDCRFAAEWMRNTGLFVGETIGGAACFCPEKAVSKGEFLTMLMESLDIPVDAQADYEAVSEDAPLWLRPYLAAALRSGLTAHLPASESGSFEADAPISGAEAAVMLQNALDLTLTQEVREDVPAWAATALAAMEENGIVLDAQAELNRGQVANLLYQISLLAPNAPGTAVFRVQQ